MGKTIQVAKDRAFDEAQTVVPAEVARGDYIKNPPGAQALKLMYLFISVAGGRMADDVPHQFRLSEIRKISGMKNHDRASLEPLIADLASVVLVHDDMEKQRVTISGIVDEGSIDYRDENSGDLVVTWTFRRAFQRMAAESNHWAILDRQTIFSLSSKYSILLFQHIASLVNLHHIEAKTFTIPELRTLFGIPAGKVKRFADLNKDVLTLAINDINQLSRLNLTATPKKIGRTVVGVEIKWASKELEEKAKAIRELKGHSAGRKARRNGTAEIIAAVFPETGSITYSPHWLEIKRAAGCNADNAKIATDFRRFLLDKGIARDAANIEKLFGDYCRKVGKV
ncbi:replication initiation protein [Paracoccus nototheniae]